MESDSIKSHLKNEPKKGRMNFGMGGVSMRNINGGGMRSWGFRGDEPITRYETCQRVMRLPNHLNPNYV